MIYVFIKDNEGIFPIDKMCNVLEVGLRSYYRWKRSSTSKRELKKEKFKRLITDIYFEFEQRYGSPRITVELQSRGHKISRITVAKYMKEKELRSKLAKKFKATTDSKQIGRAHV